MTARSRPGAAWRKAWAPLLALALGSGCVIGYDWTLAPSRYPYFGDSASYIEMAQGLRSDGRALVTPWDVEPGDRDAVPQPLFPPGFSLLIAALTPLTGEVRTAALIPGRVAAALLPLLLLAMFRRSLPDAALLCIGVWVLLSPGVRDWHFVAYSDVPSLALAVVALGALARGIRAAGDEARNPDRRDSATASEPLRPGWLLVAGFAAGLVYGVRNAGLAVLAASLATLVYVAWSARGAWRALIPWSLGAAVPLTALAAYNLNTFGELQPYTMPPSARPWPLNLSDWAGAQLLDLLVPLRAVEALPPFAAVAVVGGLLAAGVLFCWRVRRHAPQHRLLLLLGAYVVTSGALLVLSRSRYEWGSLIEPRNTLQYTWAFALVLVLVARGALPMRARRVAAAFAVVALVVSGADAALEARSLRARGPDQWLALSRDAEVMAAARALPAEALIASNTAVLFRIGVPRPVRQLDVGGDDGDFAGSLELLRRAAGPRAAAFLLVCNEYTSEFTACRGQAAVTGAACSRVRSEPPVVAVCRLARPPALASKES
jgi:hypothetical protein